MTPYFGARLPNGTWTIQLTEGGVVRGTANIVVDDANPLYWIGNRTDVRSAWRALVVAMLAVPGATGVYDLSFSSTDAEGVRGRVYAPSAAAFSVTFTAGDHEWFGLSSATNTATLASGLWSFYSDMPAWGTWFPKSTLVNEDDWKPVARQGGTSDLTADGTAFAVQQDDGDLREWLCIRVAYVHGARIRYRRSIAPSTRPWWRNAGLAASLAGTASADTFALDAPRGWWWRTGLGVVDFVCVLDEATCISTGAGVHVGQIVYDESAPVSMSGWRRLTDPNVVQVVNADGATDVSICFRSE